MGIYAWRESGHEVITIKIIRDSGLNNNILEELMYYFTLSEEEARNICAAFYLEEDDIYKKISSLSGGEKGKSCIYRLMLEKPFFNSG